MENFKYKLKNNLLEEINSNYLQHYLENLNIQKTASFTVEPSKQDEESPDNLENITELCQALHEGFINDKNFFLQIDSDADGITSSAIFYNYFKELYPDVNIRYRVHDGKEHGIFTDTIPVESDYIIIPDAGSNDFDEQKELAKQGRKVLIMDHHSVDTFEEVENTIIVNNQLSSRFKNKALSGAGVVYKVIQKYDEMYNNNSKLYYQYTDLAALGIVSDMMDTRQLDNNFIIYHGLRSIKNPMLQQLLEKQSYSVSNPVNPNKIDLAFYITPLINAVIRMGSIEENRQLFKGFINKDFETKYTRTWHGKAIEENIFEKVARESGNIRNKQNRIKEKALVFLDQRIQENKLYEDPIIVVEASKYDDVTVPKTMTGLVAMEILKKYKKPVLVLRPKKIDGEEYLFGSGRASKTEGFNSFRNELNKTEVVKFAQGHDMAFGTGVKRSELPKLLEVIGEQLSDVDFGEQVVEVDHIFYDKEINSEMLREFAEVMNIYGNGIAQPKFAFEFSIPASAIKLMGKKRNAMKFNIGDINLIKFREKEGAELVNNNNSSIINVKCVGRSQINEFRGFKNVQIILDYLDMEVEEMEMMF